jgi:FKBP-type peptidyl-prolyl cis-trans isomerase
MIRTNLLIFAMATALAGCSSDAPAPQEDPVRAEIDAASKLARSTESATADTETQPTEEPDLTDVFAGMIPWDASRDGLVTTDSGLQIHVVNAGDAEGARPGINDRVSVNYEGRLAENGDTFDSSFERGTPAEFGVTQVIPGWTEALQLMRPGD